MSKIEAISPSSRRVSDFLSGAIYYLNEKMEIFWSDRDHVSISMPKSNPLVNPLVVFCVYTAIYLSISYECQTGFPAKNAADDQRSLNWIPRKYASDKDKCFWIYFLIFEEP